MIEFGRIMVILGITLALIGAVILAAGRLFPWLGNLPGDFNFQGQNFKIYFPLATMLLISILVTILLNILIRIFRR